MKMIKYTLLKAVQIIALITLPIIIYNQVIVELSFWSLFSIYVFFMYISDISNRTLEKKLHGELY